MTSRDRDREILIKLRVFQIKGVKNYDRLGYKTNKVERMRMNPYNPLTYLLLLSVAIAGTICFGIIGFWEAAYECGNPLKWR